MSGKYIDMHIHTYMSDGTMSPEDCIILALKNGIGTVAITDHNSFAGVEDALYFGKKYGIEVIPAIEFNTALMDNLHFLVYFNNMNFLQLQSFISNMDFAVTYGKPYTNKQVFDKMKENGGKIFMAHPMKYGFENEELLNQIEAYKNMGLDGIEAYHNSTNLEQSRYLTQIANDKNLLICGGSDFHGEMRPNIKLGFGSENTMIDYEIWENIKKTMQF